MYSNNTPDCCRTFVTELEIIEKNHLDYGKILFAKKKLNFLFLEEKKKRLNIVLSLKSLKNTQNDQLIDPFTRKQNFTKTIYSINELFDFHHEQMQIIQMILIFYKEVMEMQNKRIGVMSVILKEKLKKLKKECPLQSSINNCSEAIDIIEKCRQKNEKRLFQFEKDLKFFVLKNIDNGVNTQFKNKLY